MSNEKITMKNIPDDEFFYGHKGCPGCGGSLAVRLALKVIGRRSYTVLPAGCMAAVGFVYPQMAFSTNAILSTFPGTASMLSGITAGARSLGIEDYYAVGFAGDGGTADIGIQALSGAIDRNDRLIYICYDNEGYMNTGIQKSGLTPYGTRTTTTPAGTNLPGSVTHKKNLFEIIAAHGIEYAAVASIGYPLESGRQNSAVEPRLFMSMPVARPVGESPKRPASKSQKRRWTVVCGRLPSTKTASLP
jgi:pyruvate ferredoxin oxidoreductase beta subunit